jgi:predicted nuclease of predicted toxin-antitoxin system
MKFLADMGISPRSVKGLSEAGHDAVHLTERGLGRLTDSAILDIARQENRVVLTSDLDFGDLLAASHESLPSVIIFRLKDMRSSNITYYLEQALERYFSALETGAIISISERRIRVRKLPIR